MCATQTGLLVVFLLCFLHSFQGAKQVGHEINKWAMQVLLQRDEVTKPGQVQRIKGEGMPKLGNEKVRGDLIVTYHVSFPTRLTHEQKQTVRKLFV
jgi:DnaJ-class molecular chaperone